jgi:hypothetical protein
MTALLAPPPVRSLATGPVPTFSVIVAAFQAAATVAIATTRSRALVAEAEEAVRWARPGRRRLLASVAAASGVSPRTRTRAIAPSSPLGSLLVTFDCAAIQTIGCSHARSRGKAHERTLLGAGLSPVSQMERRPDGRWQRRHGVAHALEPVVA